MEGLDGLELIARAVQHTLVSVRCREWAILEPEAAKGLGRAAGFHRDKSAALLNEAAQAGDGLAGRRVNFGARPHAPGSWGGVGPGAWLG